MIRSTWVVLNLFIATVILGTVCVIGGLVRAPGGLFHWASSTWSAWMLWASNVEVVIEGAENVHITEPQLLVSNHQSWYDVLALAANIPKRYRFITKKELSYVPLFGQAWQAAGHIAIDRTDRVAAVKALDDAGRLIRSDGSAIVIFPEGTRSSDGQLMPFKKGGFVLATHLGVAVVPVACIGTREVLPKNGWRVRPGRIIVRFGDPIATEAYDETRREELMALVRSRIEQLMEPRMINV